MRLDASPTGRQILFGTLYFSEGAPIGFLWWALPVRLRLSGVEPAEIAGLIALLALPWAFKFLWAPAVDLWRSPRFTLRGWILCAQAAMSAALLPLIWLDWRADFGWLVTLILLHACAAATQDAAIDSLAIGTLPPAERGRANAWMQVGMLGARAVFGGAALVVADVLGDRSLIVGLIGAIWIASATVIVGVGRDTLAPPVAPIGERAARLASAVRAAVRRRATWLGIVFAATAGAGFKAATALGGTFLVDQGASGALVGSFFLLPVVVAMSVGAWLGGRASDTWPRRWTVGLSEAASALLVALLGLAALLLPAGTGIPVLLGIFTLLYLAIGFATASSYALFMDLTDPRLAATQFCAFMSGINLCESWSTRTLGGLIAVWGYGPAFVAMAIPSLVALVLLPALTPAPDAERPAGEPLVSPVLPSSSHAGGTE